MINKNDFIRISWSGEIGQVVEILKDNWYKVKFVGYTYLKKVRIDEHDFRVLYSSSLLDILKVGDYVNGYKIIHIYGTYVAVDKGGKEYTLCFEEHEIEEVLSKEKYESNLFKTNFKQVSDLYYLTDKEKNIVNKRRI